MMQHKTITDTNRNSTATISTFCIDNSIYEYQLMIQVTNTSHPFEKPLESLFNLFKENREKTLNHATHEFQRFFLSDTPHQTHMYT